MVYNYKTLWNHFSVFFENSPQRPPNLPHSDYSDHDFNEEKMLHDVFDLDLSDEETLHDVYIQTPYGDIQLGRRDRKLVC